MKYTYIHLTLLIVFFYSCTNNKDTKSSVAEGVVTIELDLKGETQSIHDIDLIKDVEIIKLECDDVIGKINKVIRFGDKVYLLDILQNKCVYIFSMGGKYINTIANYGQGPNEYLQLFDIFINKEDSTLNLLSRNDKKLFKYDLDGKELIGIETMPKSFTSMLKTNKGFFAYMANYAEDSSRPNNIWLLDKDYKPIDSYFSIGDIKGHSMNGSAISSYDNDFYYVREGDFSVYSVKDGEVTIKYAVDMNGLQRSEQNGAGYDVSNDKYVERIYNFQETKDHTLVSFVFNGQYMIGVYNKKNGKSNVVTLKPYSKKYFISFGNIVSFDEQSIYAISTASSIKRSWVGKDDYNDFTKDYPEQIKNLRSKFKSIDEEDNPFLIVYSLDE